MDFESEQHGLQPLFRAMLVQVSMFRLATATSSLLLTARPALRAMQQPDRGVATTKDQAASRSRKSGHSSLPTSWGGVGFQRARSQHDGEAGVRKLGGSASPSPTSMRPSPSYVKCNETRQVQFGILSSVSGPALKRVNGACMHGAYARR